MFCGVALVTGAGAVTLCRSCDCKLLQLAFRLLIAAISAELVVLLNKLSHCASPQPSTLISVAPLGSVNCMNTRPLICNEAVNVAPANSIVDGGGVVLTGTLTSSLPLVGGAVSAGATVSGSAVGGGGATDAWPVSAAAGGGVCGVLTLLALTFEDEFAETVAAAAAAAACCARCAGSSSVLGAA
jgi:hypothetical protein